MKSLILLAFASLGVAMAQSTCKPSPEFYVLPDGYIGKSYLQTVSYVNGMTVARQEYLRRLLRVLKSRGTEVFFTLIPYGMDSEHARNPDLQNRNPEKHARSYADIMGAFKSSGAQAVDLFQAFSEMRKNNPGVYFQLKRDDHWSQDAVQVAAQATQKHLVQHHPALAEEIAVSSNRVVVTGSFVFPGIKEKQIKERYCPDFPQVGDVIQKYDLEEETGLFDDVVYPVTLFGTSYSSNPVGFGFDVFLANQLQTRVVNEAISGGGPFGSFMDHFLKPDAVFPRVIVWEFGVFQFDDKNNPFSELSFRQALPMVSRTLPVQTQTGQSEQKEVTWKNVPQGGFQAVHLRFVDTNTSNVVVTLQHEKGRETLTLTRTRLKNNKDYFLELRPELGALKEITVQTPEVSRVGRVQLEFLRYVD